MQQQQLGGGGLNLGGLGLGGGLGQAGGLGGGFGQAGGLGGGLGQAGGLGGGLGQAGGLGGGLGQMGGLGGGLGQTGGLGGGLGQGLGQMGGLGGGLGQMGGLGGGLGQTGGLGGGLGQTGGLGGGIGQMGGLGGGLKFGGLSGLGGLGQQNVGLGTGLGGVSLGGGTGLGLGGAFAGGQKSNTGQLQPVPQAQVMLNALQSPAVFSDDRDVTLMKFNHLQAYCGTGKGLASYMGQPQSVDFTPENPFCRFKAICYCRLPTSRNEDGLVALQFNKKDTDILSSQDAIAKKLQECLPDPRTMQAVVSGVRPLPDDQSEMTIYILEKSAMGGSRRMLAVDVFMYLQNLGQNPNWKSIRDDLSNMYPLIGMNDESLKIYLQNLPAGINPRLWDQGKQDNPDPQKYIPVVVTGFPSLLRRVKQQEQETKQHQRRLEMIDSDLQDLQRSHALTVATVTECKAKLLDLSHRVLRVMVMQEILRRSGYSIQPEEEQLRVRLENIQAELDAPLKFKGRLNELMSVLRMQLLVPGARPEGKYAIDPLVFEDIKQHLQQQQGALLQLVKVIKEDGEDLNCIEEGFRQTQ